MKTQKMTNQVKAMVQVVNEYLRENHVKDIQDSLFSDMCYLLSRAGCYHGFNLYTIDGKLSGHNLETVDHLEIYIV